jgi:hypothetical protein
MIDDLRTEADKHDLEVRTGRRAAALVLATAALVGVAGFLSIREDVPSWSSPFALLTTFPAFWIFELDERTWSPAVPFALSSLPVVMGFLLSSLHLLRKTTEIPQRSVKTLFAFILLNALWFWAGWAYGIQYQGRSHVLYIAVCNAAFIGAALGLLLINSKTPRFGINLAFQGVVFAWLAWCALPWMGEMP